MRKPLLMATLSAWIALSALTLLAGPASAADGDCAAKAAEKKLAGAAKTSFTKKCEKDAGAAAASAPAMSATSTTCQKTAADKKLAGAAKASFMKKCSADEMAAMKK